MKVFRAMLFAFLVSAAPCAAQTPVWDNSGNGLLKGTYYFREVIYLVSDNVGDLNRALSLYGNISFDGNGNYSINGASVLDSQAGSVQTLTVSGTYTIAANGYGFFTNPLSSGTNVYTVYGLVSNGIFIGSDTENGFNDMFVAAPLATPQPTNSSFQGSYAIAGFLPGGSPGNMADTFFQLNPDGAGNLGTVSVKGYYGSGGSTAVTQTNNSVKYFFSNGGANISFPNSSTAPFYSGSEYLYMSADGNFVFGGSPVDYDIFVGVKIAPSGAQQKLTGLYYEAGIDEDTSQLASAGYGNLDSYYGSFNAIGGYIVGHERLLSLFNNSVEGFTFSSTYPASIPGTYTDPSGTTSYTLSANGAIRIAYGIGPYLGINVALQAPSLSGQGVFLNPSGVTNSASSSPFTAGISNGELITLYGVNLAPGTMVASVVPFPTSLDGVQVIINGTPAPIYYVSPTQLSVIVPYSVATSIAQIQILNNGVSSNTITQFVEKTTPGVFTLSANGIGYGAIEHADGSLVTSANPARIGETIAVFMAGLGPVTPAVTEGSVGPSNPLSTTVNTIAAYVAGTTATVTYSGLAPYLAGLYQVNLTIPSGVTPGDNNLDIAGPDSYTAQAVIPVGAAAATSSALLSRPEVTSAVKAAPRLRGPAGKRTLVRHSRPCFVTDTECAAQ